ncbi:MAG: hypothetical protein DYG92_01150 [Leptolyngbya sp. PLA1]|nr:hypothetical protein [Leptolyngbya sp. PLA1]
MYTRPNGPLGLHDCGALPDAGLDEHDALADLFLSETAPVLKLAGEAPPVVRPTIPRIEGLVLGHLPVLAAAWVVQYAKHAADESNQTIGLVRVQGGQVWVDLVLPRGATPRNSSRIGVAESATDLRGAIAVAAREAGRWLVRVDEIDEPELLTTPGVGAVTLLTGADMPAIVASYRTIKNLCGEEPVAMDAVSRVRLAIMGADDQAAAEAEARIAKASRTFLGGSIACAARVGKIAASSTRVIYRGPGAPTLAELVSLIDGAGEPAQPEKHAAPTAEPPVVRAEGPSPRSGVETAPAAAPSVGAQGAEIAELIGLKPLGAGCPVAPGVVLARGHAGELHLVAHAPEREADRAVGGLLAAAAWAEQNRPLIDAAFPGGTTGDAGPALHVVVDDARGARGLLDTGVRVHLAIEAALDGRVVRVARELN